MTQDTPISEALVAVVSRLDWAALGAKVGAAVILAALATGIWARGNLRFWSSRIGGTGLVAHGALGSGFLALSIAAWAWASPY